MTTLKEEIKARSIKQSPTKVFSYIHGEGRIGVLLELEAQTDFCLRTDEIKLLAKEIMLQIASMNPPFLGESDAFHYLESRKTMFRLLPEMTTKPDNIIDKIVEGKLKKVIKEKCLLNQPWVKESSKNITDLINETEEVVKEDIIIKNFKRFGN